MEPRCLLAYTKQPVICSYLEPDEITLCRPILNMFCHKCPLSSSVNAENDAFVHSVICALFEYVQ